MTAANNYIEFGIRAAYAVEVESVKSSIRAECDTAPKRYVPDCQLPVCEFLSLDGMAVGWL